jgi:hypothetical protein
MSRLKQPVDHSEKQKHQLREFLQQLQIVRLPELIQIIIDYWIIYPQRFQLSSFRVPHQKDREYWIGDPNRKQSECTSQLVIEIRQQPTRDTVTWWNIGWIEPTEANRTKLFLNTSYAIGPACIHDGIRTTFMATSDFVQGVDVIHPSLIYNSQHYMIKITVTSGIVFYDFMREDHTWSCIGLYPNVNLEHLVPILMIPPEFSIVVVDTSDN